MSRVTYHPHTERRLTRAIHFCVLLAFCQQACAGHAPLRVSLLSGSAQYRSDVSLRKLQEELESHYGCECAWVQGRDRGKELKGIEALDRCDVMVVFVRRMEPPSAQLERVKKYCDAGKPIVGIRTASHAFQKWLEFDKLVLGGNYRGHYGDAAAQVRFEDKAKGHPVLAGVKPFRAYGGLYKNQGHAKDVGLLLTAATKQHSEPVAWTRARQGGRVFYTSLGHPRDFGDRNFMRMLVNAIFWTAKREAKRIELTPEAVLDRSIRRIATYRFGQSRRYLNAVERYRFVTREDPERRRLLSKRLCDLLRSDATLDCKRFVCRELALIGTAEAVPALVDALADKELMLRAAGALATIREPAATAALRRALHTTQGPAQAGIIIALGSRRDQGIVPALARLLTDSDPAAAHLAANALGSIGTLEAAKALQAVQDKMEVAHDLLFCAERMSADGDKEAAETIYRQLHSTDQPKHIRRAALQGLVDVGAKDAADLVVAALHDADEKVQADATRYARYLLVSGLAKTFAVQLPHLEPPGQVLLLDALADRGDRSVMPAVAAATKSKDAGVRVAALRALTGVGDASVVPLLARAASSSSRAERDAAARSLNRLRGRDVDAAMVAHLAKAEPKARAAVIRSLVARRASSATPALLEAAKDSERSVRTEAYQALGVLADEKTLPAVVQLVLTAKPGSEQTAAEQALAAACRRVADEQRRTAPVLAALAGASVSAQCSLLRVLGGIGGGRARDTLKAALKSNEAKIVDAAVRGFAQWPDASAAGELIQTAQESPQLIHRVLALRGYVRVVGLRSKRSRKDTVKMLAKAMAAAERIDEKKLVLASVAAVKDMAALKMAETHLEDEELKAEAAAAIVKICGHCRRPRKERDQILAALDKVQQVAKSERTREGAKKLIKKLKK